MPQTLLAVDTRDDRAEVVTLLNKLPPRKRVEFIAWCCRACAKPNRSCPVPMYDPQLIREAERCDRGSDRLTNTVLLDWYACGTQWDLDMPAAARALEQLVRRGALPQPPQPG